MSLNTPYRVVPCTLDRVISLLAEVSASTSLAQIASKQHVSYLFDYLDSLGAKTIVLETRYIDHDYLEDYAGYYVRCFNRYRRTTSRLHFFSQSFNSRQFSSVVLDSPNNRLGKKIANSYLGFIVVKPLPQTVIGRTCLKTYPSDNGRRQFPTLHKYSTNLFGLPLSVESLAYQEQDKVVAACATSALWSVFQGSGKVFHHPIPSPIEITKASSVHIPDSGAVPHESRSLHHSGLTPTQIAHGVRSVGMDPYLIGASNEYVLKTTAYAYMKAKIPALLGIGLNEIANGVTKKIGLHAVVLTGYSLGHPQPSPFSNSNILITASRIDKIYVHDDQIGPFARMVFTANNMMETAWLDSSGIKGNVYADPFMLMIPLYHKIRIPYQIILDKVAIFDATLEVLRAANFVPLTTRLEWDIYLCEVNDFKKEISTNTKLDKKTKRDALLINMPKYLWRATGLDNGIQKFDVLFDATDIEQGAIIITILVYDAALKLILISIYAGISHLLNEATSMFFRKISKPPSFKPIE